MAVRPVGSAPMTACASRLLPAPVSPITVRQPPGLESQRYRPDERRVRRPDHDLLQLEPRHQWRARSVLPTSRCRGDDDEDEAPDGLEDEPGGLSPVREKLAHHHSPLGGGRPETDADESERGHRRNRRRGPERGDGEHSGRDLRPDVPVEDMARPEAEEARGLDGRRREQHARPGAGVPEVLDPQGEGDPDVEGPPGTGGDGGEHEDEQQARQGQHGIGDCPEEAIGPPSPPGSEHAERRTGKRRGQYGQAGERQGEPGPGEQSAGHVAAEVIGAERMGGARTGQRIQQRLPRGVDAENLTANRCRDHHDPEHRGAGEAAGIHARVLGSMARQTRSTPRLRAT